MDNALYNHAWVELVGTKVVVEHMAMGTMVQVLRLRSFDKGVQHSA